MALLVVMVVVIRHMGARAGLLLALLWIVPTLVAFAISASLLLYWWLPDPSHFTPLGTTRAVGGSGGTIVLGAVWLAVLVIIVIKRLDATAVSWLALPVLAITAIASPPQLYRGVAYVLWAVPLLVQRVSETPPAVISAGYDTSDETGPRADDRLTENPEPA